MRMEFERTKNKYENKIDLYLSHDNSFDMGLNVNGIPNTRHPLGVKESSSNKNPIHYIYILGEMYRRKCKSKNNRQ